MDDILTLLDYIIFFVKIRDEKKGEFDNHKLIILVDKIGVELRKKL